MVSRPVLPIPVLASHCGFLATLPSLSRTCQTIATPHSLGCVCGFLLPSLRATLQCAPCAPLNDGRLRPLHLAPTSTSARRVCLSSRNRPALFLLLPHGVRYLVSPQVQSNLIYQCTWYQWQRLSSQFQWQWQALSSVWFLSLSVIRLGQIRLDQISLQYQYYQYTQQQIRLDQIRLGSISILHSRLGWIGFDQFEVSVLFVYVVSSEFSLGQFRLDQFRLDQSLCSICILSRSDRRRGSTSGSGRRSRLRGFSLSLSLIT